MNSSKNKKVLIIGGVAGGATTAARLRRLDENAEIIILEKGGYISYANCGLPYYIGDVIKNREALLLQTPEIMKSRFNIDVRIFNEAVEIDRENKMVLVKNLSTGEGYSEAYDILVIATGSTPLKPPIPGIDGDGIYTLWTIPDTDKIKSVLTDNAPKSAAIIGGGFIGLEMAENLHKAGLAVSIIEMLDQVMAPVDFEMAQLLHENMAMNGVSLFLGDGVDSFTHEKGTPSVHLKSGRVVDADMVILSIGVKPNSILAKNAGLSLNQRGGILVDSQLRTSDSNIYAVGDVIEVENFVTKAPAMIPLAGPANKQARICADNIAGLFGTYEGSLGTSVAQVFDLSVACTGVNEKALKALGQKEGKDYYVALINQKSHAGYYPEAMLLTLKLLFDSRGKILGAQIVGADGVDKRIDTIATTMRLGGSVYDLSRLELAYAPPYSSAKDPVNMAGFVAENILGKLASFITPGELTLLMASDHNHEFTFLDVSEDMERMVFSLPGSHHIPLGQLRQRMGELDKNKLIIPYCAIGVRSYNAARILTQQGFSKVKILAGGTSFYKSVTGKHIKTGLPAAEDSIDSNHYEAPLIGRAQGKTVGENAVKVIKATVDCSGLQCPGPIMRVHSELSNMNDGEILQVSATDMGFSRDVEAWCRRTGNTLLGSERKGKEFIVTIQKGASSCNTGVAPAANHATEAAQGKTLIVFSGDLDKVLASFIIANGAAAMGRPVTMFFTFWGLNALRKNEKIRIKKPFMDKMFGAMMPRGSGKLTLSNMNMGGMGTKMMKKVMQDKNVNSLEELMKSAMNSGVKLVACTMSMDIMGITKEELIDGIQYAGVASYLGDAEESNVNLFI